MINNINIRRVKANLKELFEDKIDMRQTVDKVPVFAGTFTMSTVFLV